jgi:GTPase SAR1 family protein
LQDVSGQERVRALWKHYFPNTEALVFVVDSSDIARLEMASQEFHKLIEEADLQEVIFFLTTNQSKIYERSPL